MNNIEIDFNNEKHIEYILKLARRNNFYVPDLNYLVGGILFPEMEKLFDESTFFKSKMDVYNACPIYQLEEDRKGFLVCIDKKVVGFIIYYLEHKLNITRVNFLLIDKKYTSNGYGSYLLSLIEKTNKFIVIDKVEPDFVGYYKKKGYSEMTKMMMKMFNIEDNGYKTLLKLII